MRKKAHIWDLFFGSQFLWPQHFLHGIHAIYNDKIHNYFINYLAKLIAVNLGIIHECCFKGWEGT